jgi:hypothetical protein
MDPGSDKIFDQVNGTTSVKVRIPEGRDQTKTMTTQGKQMAWESHTYTEHTESTVPMLSTRIMMRAYVEKEREDPTRTNDKIKDN